MIYSYSHSASHAEDCGGSYDIIYAKYVHCMQFSYIKDHKLYMTSKGHLIPKEKNGTKKFLNQ